MKVSKFIIQRMKTKWGSCTPSARNIRLNTDLAHKPRECLEYIAVHEMMHRLETFGERSLEEPDMMRLVLMAGISALVNTKSIQALEAELKRRSAWGN